MDEQSHFTLVQARCSISLALQMNLLKNASLVEVRSVMIKMEVRYKGEVGISWRI